MSKTKIMILLNEGDWPGNGRVAAMLCALSVLCG